MEVAVAIAAAGASVLIAAMRFGWSWRLCKMADRSGRSIKIGGLNPLAPKVEYGSIDASAEEPGVHVPVRKANRRTRSRSRRGGRRGRRRASGGSGRRSPP